MRQLTITEGEYYHVFNRGMHKHLIFNDDRDRLRFLFSLLHFQSPITFSNTSYDVKNFSKSFFNEHSVLPKRDLVEEISRQRLVELIAFILMPNHFHLIIKEEKAGGIASYMQRLQNSFSKYTNTKNGTNGHLFQGPYKIVHIANNNQLLYVSAYLHLNCRELQTWQKKELNYPWSSFQDYVIWNRWGKLLKPMIIINQFANSKEYQKWVRNSGAKEKMEEI